MMYLKSGVLNEGARWIARLVMAAGLALAAPAVLPACSTIQLQKGQELIYGHNLNANGMDVPGLAFVNKRGIFKIGRTWKGLSSLDGADNATLQWIARYGSVTFNTFGRDLPDGGINEAGLYIWEMGLGNGEIVYPKNESLPKLDQMSWMQYVLDNFATLDEALNSLTEVELDGWGWHFFVSDCRGDCAAIDFIDGKVAVHRGAGMPVTGLFNTRYDRELELLRYYKGFGGCYEPSLTDPEVPRFVKTAVMLRDYDPSQNAVEYGFLLLKNLTVNETPDWSVIVDTRRGDIHFRTSRNPAIKTFSLKRLDFSAASPVQILNIDIPAGGDVSGQFHLFSTEEMAGLLTRLPLEVVYGSGGLKRAELVQRLATHHERATKPEAQYFAGVWKTKPAATPEETAWELRLQTGGAVVHAEISNSHGSVERVAVDHLRLTDKSLSFTFKSSKSQKVFDIHATLAGDTMRANLAAIEDSYGTLEFTRQR